MSTLFTNAKVWQPDGSFDEAFGIDGNHFNFTGSNIEAEKIRSSYDQTIGLKGRLVLPGLIDGHLHLVRGSLMLKLFDAADIFNAGELRSKILDYSLKNPSQKWIIGSNLDINSLLKNSDRVSGNFVDVIYNERPLFINNYDYHSAICSTKALEQSGLMQKLSEFSDEEVVRDSNGNPTGLIKEKAQKFVSDNLPKPSLDEKVTALEDFIDILHSYGITTVTDITLIEDLEVYKKISELGRLKIRINSYIPFYEFTNLKEHIEYTKEIDPDFFTICGFKAFWDGALGSETALFSENYLGRNHNGYKTEMVTSGQIFKLAEQINSAGLQMIIHAIGDKAVSEVLDLYESLYKPGTRHRIEHAQHLQPSDFERFKKNSVIASVQPLHLKYDAHTVKQKLPENLVSKTHNYKELIETGAVINFGTDFPIVEVNPYENIRLAYTRRTKDGVFIPELSINLHDCLKCYTINNAYSNFNENATGRVAKGKSADFVIMEDDLFDMDPDNLANAKVWKTYFDGREVYSRS